MNRSSAATLAAAIALAVMVAPGAAHADEKVQCEVVEIEASISQTPGIDPALKDLQKSLRRGPFAKYNSFKQAIRIAREMSVLREDSFATPNGEVNLIIREIDRPSKKKPRLSMGVSLEGKDGKQYIEAKQKVDAGKFAMFAYEVDDKRGIVTAIGCK